MNIILFNHDESKHATICINDHRARHIIKVIKAEVGDILLTGVINGAQGTGRIEHIDTK